MKDIITWEKISFGYGDHFQLQEIDFSVKENDFVMVLGPNGAGKTTFLKIGIGLIQPRTGIVLLDGKPLKNIPALEVAKSVAYLEQETQYHFPFTVEEVILMGRYPHTADRLWDRKEDYEMAVHAMEMTGILRFAKRAIWQLSGGERRKVEIARAICQNPRVLLLDEPTSFLDVKQKVEIFELLAKLNREQGIAVLAISHHVSLARNFAKTAVLMKDGCIEDRGPASALLTPSKLCAFFDLNPSYSAHF